MTLFRRRPDRDLVPVHFQDVEEAFRNLGPEDAAKVQHLHLSATNDAIPHDVLWIAPDHANLLGLEANK